MNCEGAIDESLNRSLRAKSTEAYTCIKECLKRRVSSQTWRKSFSHLELEDLYQETMIKVYIHVERRKNVVGEKLCSWAVRAFINTTIDIFRENKRTLPTDFSEKENQTRSEGNIILQDGSIQKFEESDYIRKILKTLPKHQEKLLEEHYLHGVEIKEIAERSNGNYTSIQNNKNRALTKLYSTISKSNDI